MRFHLSLLIFVFARAQGECEYNGGNLTFSKIPGFSPRLPTQPQLLYSSTYGAAITAECYNRCRGTSECIGFILDYAKSSCFQVAKSQLQASGHNDFVSSYGSSFFLKVCLPLPGNCSSKAWSTEVTPGYELVGFQHTIIPNVPNRWLCAKECLSQGGRGGGGPPCLSANYNIETATCTLSSHTRLTDPDAFIPSGPKGSDYIENRCLSDDRVRCWHDPLFNKTSLRADLSILNITQDECESRCELEMTFECLAYSYIEGFPPQCLLHTDLGVKSIGPPLGPPLVPTRDALYRETVQCLDLGVNCTNSSMVVTLNYPNFNGQLYVLGSPNTCSNPGRGQPTTTLVIPIPNRKGDENKCNVNVAYSLGSVNRTLASTVVSVQFHQLIQTASDRIIKVNCLISETNIAGPSNVTLAAGISIQEPGVENEINGVGGGVFFNGTTPKATMRVVDARTGQPAQNIQLGDPLELLITIDPPFNVSMVRGGHLIASSGSHDDSLLLLDWRGCPPDLTTFPALYPKSPTTLGARFRAFRFPSSPLLTLSIVLTFCSQVCQPTDCGNGVISYGKKRRRRSADVYEELPLQLAILVNSPETAALNDTNVIGASFVGGITGEHNQLICSDFITVAIVILFWVLVQCILLALCCYSLHRKGTSHPDTMSLQHDFQPRHTNWSDDHEIPSRRLWLSTPKST